jgi:pimeloyl-ACP methyl ester carboxylesterase
VVLEAGLDLHGSLAWTSVHDSLAATTRACAYSRAGIMWSDPSAEPFESRRVTEDLHAALTRGGESAPWVMVGHSLGGPYIMQFTSRYGDEVAGLVFVDASHPDQRARLEAAQSATSGSARFMERALFALAPALSRLGVARLLAGDDAPASWAPAMRAAYRAHVPTSLVAMLDEQRALDSTFAAAGRFRRLDDRPLVVLTATAPTPPERLEMQGITREEDERMQSVWRSLHDDETTWSTRGRHELVPDASHYIQFDRPDVVVAAVREVVAELR